jgi:hypothetical protein
VEVIVKDPRFWGVLFVLAVEFPVTTADLLLFGYSLNEAVAAAGTVAIVTAEVIRRLIFNGRGPSTGQLA